MKHVACVSVCVGSVESWTPLTWPALGFRFIQNSIALKFMAAGHTQRPTEKFSRARVFLYVEWKEDREAGLGEGGVNTRATFLACCVPYLFLCASIC